MEGKQKSLKHVNLLKNFRKEKELKRFGGTI